MFFLSVGMEKIEAAAVFTWPVFGPCLKSPEIAGYTSKLELSSREIQEEEQAYSSPVQT